MVVIEKPQPFWIESEESKRDTTSLVKGNSIETIESQTRQDQLYSGLPNLAEEGKNERPSQYSKSWLIWL